MNFNKVKYMAFLFVMSILVAFLNVRELIKTVTKENSTALAALYICGAAFWIGVVVYAGAMFYDAWKAYEGIWKEKVKRAREWLKDIAGRATWLVFLVLVNIFLCVYFIPVLFRHGSSLAFEFGIFAVLASIAINYYVIFEIVMKGSKK